MYMTYWSFGCLKMSKRGERQWSLTVAGRKSRYKTCIDTLRERKVRYQFSRSENAKNMTSVF